MSRTERPEQIMAPALRSIIKTIDLAIENGSLDPKDRDEVIKMFISGPTTVVDNKAGGGMMNMDEMIRPLGYEEGGDVGSFAEQRSLLDRINDFFKYQRKDPERFFGGSDGMEFHLDDLSLIEFIKRRAGTENENSPEYRDELMKFMEEVTPKKNMGGIISLSGGKY